MVRTKYQEDMSVNSSSSSSDSLLHPNISSINSFLPSTLHCHFIKPGSSNFLAYNFMTILLLLPLCIFILHLGLQQWRQQRSTSTAAATSHSDSFTYHMVAMELIGVLGHIISCCGIFKDQVNTFFVGFLFLSFTYYGEMLFHILTCAEHYLAVIHPITYLSLRRERGIRIRNIIIGCIWAFSVGITALWTVQNIVSILDFCLFVFSLISTFFCSLSVLHILIRPGPGEQGGDRERVDQSKQKAFYTILVILGVLLLRCAGSLMWVSFTLSGSHDCVTVTVEIWFNFPSSLVLPLLFLRRAGILACCKKYTK